MAPLKKILLPLLALYLATPTLCAPVETAALSARQLAGTGAAADSILTSTDNGVGYGIENAEDNTANLISGTKGTTGSTGSNPPPPPPPPPHKRQLDKIANGAGAIANAAGVGAVANPAVQAADSLDGTTTSGQADAGAKIGQTEESTLESVGSAVP